MGARESWNETASTYVSIPRTLNAEVNLAAIIRHLSDIAGRTVLDYGCRAAHFARRLKEMGAKEVIAADTSAAMIELAAAEDPHSTVRYHHMADNSLRFLPDDSVDAVVANLVFMMASTAKEIAESMHEIGGSCAAAGSSST